MSSSGSSQPSRAGPPHIRLNSGTVDIFAADLFSEPVHRLSLRQPSERPLTGSSFGLQPPASALYTQANGEEGAELLLLRPQKTRIRKFREEDMHIRPPISPASPMSAEFSSRRSSWSSESMGSRDSRVGHFISTFDDSRAPSRINSDDEHLNTQTVAEKYNILPSAGLLLFPEDVEKDDWLHNPDPNDNDHRDCDVFSRRGLVNLGGLAFITIGILMLFIGYPVLSYVNKTIEPEEPDPCASNPVCINAGNIPLLKNIRRGLIDPDTPDVAKTRITSKGKKQILVYSDEFSKDGRSFYDGDDPYWQAVDIWYGVTGDLEWYDPDAATTKDGTLQIRFDAFQNHNLNYRSAMLQSWNKLCFKGGHMEASISLPGRGDTIGFWPGFWSMGNLGRPGYAATTDGMWPYSYHDKCDLGITANQSQSDGLSFLPGMRLPACTCKGEDHPSSGRSRSAPEIDALEASVMYLDPPNNAAVGQASQSYQTAPFDIFWQPDYDFIEIYDQHLTGMNSYQGSVYQQAVSGLTNLNNNWYEGKAYQKYSFEYEPGEKGYITWYVGDKKSWTMDARAVGPNGNVGQRVIPQEPMAMVINFGMSNGFAALNLTGLGPLMPATMRIDYVRIYQDEDNQLMTCDPPGYPTTEYIAKHPEPYNNPNLTLWKQTKYSWPQNSLVNECT